MTRLIKILVVIFILVGVCFFTYSRVKNWNANKVETALEQEREKWQKETDRLEDRIESQQEELVLQQKAITPHEKMDEVFGESLTSSLSSPKEKTCQEIAQPVEAFFSYLDNQDYIKSYKIKQGTFKLFEQTVSQISANLPMVSEETKDLLSLLHNIAHFYRVLGKSRVKLIKDVLENESEITESMMETLFSWFMSKDKCQEQTRQGQPIEILYEYAGYFLNTLAGRSYLLRRDSKTRIITIYYCVLIIDKANDKKINSNGIDIRPHIESSLNNMFDQNRLIGRKQYLTTLEKLKVKYEI
jgi:hypothetical protein